MKIRFQVTTKAQGIFWARVLKLEEELEQVRQIMQVPGPRKEAAAPVIAEYKVDEGLIFIYFLVYNIDSIGISQCVGNLYLCDKANEKEILEVRDKLAQDVLGSMERGELGRRYDEVIEMPTKKEE